MKILLFRTGQLGDALVSVPAMHAIKLKYPKSKVDLLYDQHIGKTYVVSKELLNGAHVFDNMVSYPIAYTTAEKLPTLWAILKLFVRIRRERYDLVIHLEPEMKIPSRLERDKIFFRLAGIREQISTLQYRTPRGTTRPLEALEHESDFFLRALGEQDFDVPSPGQGSMNLALGAQETEEVKNWISKIEDGRLGRVSGVAEAIPFSEHLPISAPGSQFPANSIGIGVGSKMQSKRWPLERFREVLSRLIDTYDITPVFIGGPEDAEAAEQLIHNLGRGLNASGQLSLRGSARALQDCCFYLGNDTGTMHLAVAAGIKCVAIFSARDVPGKWYPYGEGHKVHRVPVDCEGCLLYDCHEQGRKCLMAINPEEVYQSCVELLNNRDALN